MSDERPPSIPNTFERCRECKNWLPLDENEYIVSHRTLHVDGIRRVHPIKDLSNVIRYDLDGDVCHGGQKRSLEWKQRAFERKWANHDAQVRAVALDAEIAYDDYLSAQRRIDTTKYLELAIEEYKKRHGSAAISKAKYYISARSGGGDWRNHKMDVYCTLCRGLLLARISTAANPLAFPKVMDHAVRCALLCLSGRQEYMPPDHRGLTVDDRAFAD